MPCARVRDSHPIGRAPRVVEPVRIGPNGNNLPMTAVAQLQSCDGFSVEGLEGLIGWVEETWLDDSGHPAALAVRTSDGRRAPLLTDAVRAIDPDTQQVIVAAHLELKELDSPRIASADSTVTASWRTTGAVVEPAGAALGTLPPALAASRTVSAHRHPGRSSRSDSAASRAWLRSRSASPSSSHTSSPVVRTSALSQERRCSVRLEYRPWHVRGLRQRRTASTTPDRSPSGPIPPSGVHDAFVSSAGTMNGRA